MKKNEQITRRQFLKGALAGAAGLATVSILGHAAFAQGGIVDPAIGNEVHVTSDTPYVMSGDQTHFCRTRCSPPAIQCPSSASAPMPCSRTWRKTAYTTP